MLRTKGEKAFSVVNAVLLSLVALACLIPVWHVFCASVSEPSLLNATRGAVIWPLGKWDFGGYEQVFQTKYILQGYANTLYYVVVETVIGMLLTMFAAYALSRKDLMIRKPVSLLITFTMLFSGGLVPTYMVVKNLGLMDTIWSIVITNCVNVFNVMIMRTAFASVSDTLVEAAQIDGAGHVRTLFQIILPVCKAVVAVVVLFYVVQHWNSWFRASLYLKTRTRYPLQLWLREIVIAESTGTMESEGGDVNALNLSRVLVKYCVIVISIAPMMILYPFVQKYFVTGVMIGSIKE